MSTKNEEEDSDSSCEESSESLTNGDEERSSTHVAKKLRPSKEKKHLKREKKSGKIQEVTSIGITTNPIPKQPPSDNEKDWTTVESKKNRKNSKYNNLAQNERQIQSENNKSTDRQEKSQIQEDYKPYKIHFHVFVPPYFQIDLNECEFGLITSLNNFDEDNINPLSSKQLDNGGYLVTGQLELKNKQSRFEYKYVLKIKEDETLIYEFLGKKNGKAVNRSFEKTSMCDSHHNYDGVMLPPDEETKTGLKQTFFKFFVKILGGKFYNKDMLNKCEDQTIKAMLDEVKGNKFDTVESCKTYMQNILYGLKKVFKESQQIMNVI